MITLQESHRAVFYAPFYAALARGAFAAAGVEVRLVSSPTPDQALDGLMAGTVDVGWGGPMRVNLGNRTIAGADFVCFGEVVTRDPFVLVTRRDLGAYAPERLVGLRIGSVSEVPTPWLCLQHDVRLAGADPAGIVRVGGRSMAENVAGVVAGVIDVAQLYEPYVAEAEAAGCLAWHAQADRGACSYTTFYARRGVLAARRAELVALLRGLAVTQRWVAGVSAAELAELVGGYFPGLARDRLVTALARYMRLCIWGRDPVVPRGGYERLRDGIVSGGLVATGLSFEEAVDNSLAAAALAPG